MAAYRFKTCPTNVETQDCLISACGVIALNENLSSRDASSAKRFLRVRDSAASRNTTVLNPLEKSKMGHTSDFFGYKRAFRKTFRSRTRETRSWKLKFSVSNAEVNDTGKRISVLCFESPLFRISSCGGLVPEARYTRWKISAEPKTHISTRIDRSFDSFDATRTWASDGSAVLAFYNVSTPIALASARFYRSANGLPNAERPNAVSVSFVDLTRQDRKKERSRRDVRAVRTVA